LNQASPKLISVVSGCYGHFNSKKKSSGKKCISFYSIDTL